MQFESFAERSLLLWLDRDTTVEDYLSQPEQLTYTNASGKCSTYTPDFQVWYTDGHISLHEVTLEQRLMQPRIQQCHATAKCICAERGWTYYIHTEKDLPPGSERANLMAGDKGTDTTPDKVSDPLAYLEHANLFLIALDDERIWYRYHADLLQARLQQTLSEHQIITLYERAAEWHKQSDFIYDAINHASLTANNEWVERLIEENYVDMMQHGESLSIRFWTDKLERELIYNRSLLCCCVSMKR